MSSVNGKRKMDALVALTVIFGVIAVVFIVLFAVVKAPKHIAPPPLPGSDRDKHGCIPSAGYTWCGSEQKCFRPWEEACKQ